MFAPDRVSSRWFACAVFLSSATLHVCRKMYWPNQFCAWHATSVMEFHPSQTSADRGVVLPLPGCTRFVQTAACQREMPSIVPRIGLCEERTLRPPRPCVDDNDHDGRVMSVELRHHAKFRGDQTVAEISRFWDFPTWRPSAVLKC